MEKSNIIATILSSLIQLDKSFPSVEKTLSYGTAGFRFDESLLERCAFRCGIATCLLSISQGGLPYGMMLTASHNRYTDNGIKIAGENGETLSKDKEILYEEIVNSKNLSETIEATWNKLDIKTDAKDNELRCICLLGMDTRRSGPMLSEAIIKAFKAFPFCEYKFYQIVTTPCLHFLTLASQLGYKKLGIKHKMLFPEEKDYWTFISKAYEAFMSFHLQCGGQTSFDKYEDSITIDCSAGCASYVITHIANAVPSLKTTFINIDFSKYERLNEQCGAEFVHKERKYPLNYTFANKKSLSFDGDVDRIIYFASDKGSGDSNTLLIDGDRLIVLYSTMLKFIISKMSKRFQDQFTQEISIGVITTAYANGALMDYVKNSIGFKLNLGKTGVKHLHSKAKAYDISIYFESNGHGTVHSSESLSSKIERLFCLIETSKDSQVLELLMKFIGLFNRTVGDALSSYLATECCLKIMNMSIIDVYHLYKELPSKNEKMTIKDKSIFIPNEDESRLTNPLSVQNEIDSIVSKYSKARCFIRPSGTEDVVRLYAEAEKESDVTSILQHMSSILKDY